MKRKLLSILLTLCMMLTLLPTVALADEGGSEPTTTITDSIDFATFLTALTAVKGEDNSITFDGSQYSDASKVQDGKLIVKWRPVSGCFDNRASHTCTVAKATGNTPNRENGGNAQYHVLYGTAKDVTIKNVSFVYEADDFTICANSGWAGSFNKEDVPNAQIHLGNSGDTVIENCSFDHVVFTSFNNTGKTEIKGCYFENIKNSCAIKDLGGSTASVTGCTFDNCCGAILTETWNDRNTNNTPNTTCNSLTISDNTFKNINVEGTTEDGKSGTGAVITFADKLTFTTVTLSNNSATGCGPIVNQQNSSVDLYSEESNANNAEIAKLATQSGSDMFTENTKTSIDFDAFLKLLTADSSGNVSYNGGDHPLAVDGKLTVKWSPVSGCYTNNSGSYDNSCKVTTKTGNEAKNHKAATGNTPRRVNDGNAQYYVSDGNAKNVTISNINFVYEPTSFILCNGSWSYTDTTVPQNAQFYLQNTGSTTIENCSFDHVIFTSFCNKGAAVIENCSFSNITNNYAIKDLGGSSATVTGCTFTNCSGGIMTADYSAKGQGIAGADAANPTLTITGNTFDNVGYGTYTYGTRTESPCAIIAIMKGQDGGVTYNSENGVTLSGNTATGCGSVVFQKNESVSLSTDADNWAEIDKLAGTSAVFVTGSIEPKAGANDPAVYTVTFDTSVESMTVAERKVVSGMSITLPSLSRNGSYVFGGWLLNGSLYQAGATYEVTGDANFTASWYIPSSGVSKYAVTVEESANGSVTASAKRAAKGRTVTLTVTPDKGYVLETLTVLDKNGDALTLTDNGDGTYSFKMPAGKVTVTATFMDDNTMLSFFVDVPASAYYYDAVLWAAKNEITGGIDATHFGPDLTCTRAQLVTFLWRAAGCPVVNYAMSFTDVDESEWYGEAVRWAASLGIVGGYGNGLFGTNDEVLREQVVTILYRYAVSMGMDVSVGEDTNILSYTDAFVVSEYAVSAFQWATGAGIVQGADGALMPQDSCTRGQIVTMLYRLLGE